MSRGFFDLKRHIGSRFGIIAIITMVLVAVMVIPVSSDGVTAALWKSRTTTNISITMSSSDVEVGEKLHADGLLSASTGIRYAKIYLKVILPDGTTAYPTQGSSTTTTTGGKFSMDYTPKQSGVHKLTATYYGSLVYSSSTKSVSFVAVEPYAEPTPAPAASTIRLSPASSTIEVGQSMHADGTLSSTEGISDRTVDLKVILPDGSVRTPVQGAKVVTDAAGSFDMDLVTTVAGRYVFTASFAGDATYAASSSDVSFTAYAPEEPEEVPAVASTTLTLTSDGSAVVGSDEVVTGALTTGGGAAVPGATITIQVTRPDGSKSASASVTTGSSGQFSYAYKPAVAGKHTVSASFAGTSSYASSSSSVSFEAAAAVVVPPTAYDYMVSSNIVKSSFGATVYTASTFGDALKWATSQAGKTTYVPAGRYTITGLDSQCIKPFADGVTLYGDGPDKTVLDFVWTGTFQDHRNTDTDYWNFGLRVVDHSGVTIKQLGITGDGSIAFRTNSGTSSNNRVEDVRVFDTSHHNMGAFGVSVADGTSANDYKFYRCVAYNVGGDGFDLMGDSTTTSAGYINRPYYEDCKSFYAGYSYHRWNWAVGFNLREECQVKDPTLLRCEASYSWESGFHFEYEPISLGTVTITDCVASYNGQKYSQALGACWGFGMMSGHYYGDYPNDGSHYVVTGLTGVGNAGGLEGGSYRYSGAESDAVVGYTYVISGAGTKVYGSDGSTVAYTGSSATAALQWAVSHPNAVVWLRAGTYVLTGSVQLASGVCLIGDLPTWDRPESATYLTFPSTGTSGLVIKDVDNVRVYNIGINYGNVQITASSGTVSGVDLKGVSFYQTSASRVAALSLTATSGATISGTFLGNVRSTSSAVDGYVASGTVTGTQKLLCIGL